MLTVRLLLSICWILLRAIVKFFYGPGFWAYFFCVFVLGFIEVVVWVEVHCRGWGFQELRCGTPWTATIVLTGRMINKNESGRR